MGPENIVKPDNGTIVADRVPSDDTQRIQEVHVLINHCVCQIVERLLGSTQ